MTVFHLILTYFLLESASPLKRTGQTNVTAEPGQNITLPCGSAGDRGVIAVEWRRTDLDSDYVLLYRDQQLDPEHQHPSYQNRVDLQNRPIKDDLSLVLENVTADDGGSYECRIQRGTDREKRSVLRSAPVCTVHLDVALPPPPGNMDGSTDESKDPQSHQHLGLVFPVLTTALIIGGLMWKSHVKSLPVNEADVEEGRL
ncbi:cell surface A33 antigen-like [Poecilia reticulata]|uniref:cell surface A33 antigen-like n=1 Tax=Poecilia reticulata TaxID=8081 RepID=UPI0004A3381F|nr:PREDICTED: cell surface A33 antigen-like [Poecilia reticulata]